MRFLNSLQNPRKLKVILLLLAAVVLVATGFILIKDKTNISKTGDYVFRIDGKKYSEKEVEDLTVYPRIAGLSPEESAKRLYDYLLNKRAAEKAEVNFSRDQIDIEKNKFINDKVKKIAGYDEWFELVAISGLMEQELSSVPSNKVEGYSYIFRFGEQIEASPEYRPTKYNDAVAIAEDRAYAKEKAEFYHSKLKDNSMTADQALSEVKKDPKLGYFYQANTNNSTKFGGGSANLPLQRQVSPSPVLEDATAQTQAGLTDIKTGKTTSIGISGKEQTESETYFYFLYITKANDKSMSSKIGDAKKSLNSNYKGLSL